MNDKWYLKKGDQVFGPVPVAEVQSYIKSGALKPGQLASQNEAGPWAPLKSYDLFRKGSRPIEEMFESANNNPFDETRQRPTLQSSVNNETTLIDDAYRKCDKCEFYNKQGTKYCKKCGVMLVATQGPAPTRDSLKTINPSYFTFPMWGGMALIIVSAVIFGPASESNPTGTLLMVVGGGAMFFALIYSMISLYRCWAVLQGSTARTTPGKAVGYLFIPFFNMYWWFVSIRGLAEDANEFGEQRKIPQGISVALSTWYGVLLLASAVIPLLPLVNFVLLNILIVQWSKFLNAAISTGAPYSSMQGASYSPKKSAHPIVIVSIIGGIILIPIMVAIGIPQFAAYRAKAYCSSIKSDLANFAIAQERYFTNNNIYSSVINVPGFDKDPKVTLQIIRANNSTWAASGYHENCPESYVWDSSAGGLQ